MEGDISQAVQVVERPQPNAQKVQSICINGDVSSAQLFLRTIKERSRGRVGEIEWEDEVIDASALSRLTVSNSRISSLDGLLTSFQALTHLNVSFNKISDISSVSRLKCLEVLDVSHNRIVSIDAIRNLNTLKILRCQNNVIEALEPLIGLVALSELWVSNNLIPWTEFVYLLPLTELKSLVKSGNPSEQKAKVRDFITSILPSLHFIDGQEVRAQRESSLAFLRSTDGRVMLTQAKAQLSSPARHQINIVEQQLASVIAANGDDESASSTRFARLKQLPSPAKPGVSYAGHPVPPLEPLLASVDRMNAGLGVVGRGTNSNAVGPVMKFKAKKTDWLRNKSHTITEEGNVPSSPEQSVPKKSTPLSGPTEASVDEPPLHMVRYGPSEDDPVACCIHRNGNGYVRWSKGGPVACSLENGRMMSSYRSGSIALILDPAGSGSVMDPRGRCLLVANDHGIAKVMDKTGKCIAEYRRQLSGDSRSILGGNALSTAHGPNGETDVGPHQGASEAMGSTKHHHWTFDGLHIDFYPSTWEFSVSFQNDRAACAFSSIAGGKLIREKPTVAGTKKERLPVAKAIRPFQQELSGEQHEIMRDDLMSVVSKLDQVLANIKLHDRRLPFEEMFGGVPLTEGRIGPDAECGAPLGPGVLPCGIRRRLWHPTTTSIVLESLSEHLPLASALPHLLELR